MEAPGEGLPVGRGWGSGTRAALGASPGTTSGPQPPAASPLSSRLWAPERCKPLQPPESGVGAEDGQPCLYPRLGVLKVLGKVGPGRSPPQQTAGLVTGPAPRPALPQPKVSDSRCCEALLPPAVGRGGAAAASGSLASGHLAGTGRGTAGLWGEWGQEGQITGRWG